MKRRDPIAEKLISNLEAIFIIFAPANDKAKLKGTIQQIRDNRLPVEKK
jgi:hypothetical protein